MINITHNDLYKLNILDEAWIRVHTEGGKKQDMKIKIISIQQQEEDFICSACKNKITGKYKTLARGHYHLECYDRECKRRSNKTKKTRKLKGVKRNDSFVS